MRQLKAGDRFYRGKTIRLILGGNEAPELLSFEAAIARAQANGLDLVELPSKGEHPVCRIMDYGKHMFDESKRQREARKAQVQPKVKEIKLRTTIDDNDFQTKCKHAIDFLKKGDKVKVMLFFRGREMAHPEIGEQVVQRMIKALEEYSVIDTPPRRMGKSLSVVLSVKPQYRVDRNAKDKKKPETAPPNEQNKP